MTDYRPMIEEQRLTNLDHKIISACDLLGFEVAFNYHSAYESFSAWITHVDSNSCKRYLQTTGGPHPTLRQAFDNLLEILQAHIRGELI